MVSTCSRLWWREVRRINAPSRERMPRNSRVLTCLFFLFVLIGHTSTSPTGYSPSHTETNSSGVPLIRTSVRTWFLLHPGNPCLNNLSYCVYKVTYGTLKGDTTCTGVSGWAELFVETCGFAVSKAKPWKCDDSHCLKDFSELRALCVDIYGW